MSTTQFDTALLALRPNLERYALSLVANPEDANDLLQETYLKALSNKEKFVDNTNLKAWTTVIMKNTFVNGYRKSRRHVLNYNAAYNENIGNFHEQYNPETELSHSELSRKVNELDDSFRIPFQMHTSGYKYQEIADAIHLKIGTVKSRIFLTRQKLIKELKDY